MILTICHLFLLFLLIEVHNCLYTIQCCTGDETCSSKPIDCPSNVCFKLIISNNKEERGCLDDLIQLVNSVNKDNRKLNKDNSLTSSSSNDQCHRLGSYGNGMSLCKCTSHLCNSTTFNYKSNQFIVISILCLFLVNSNLF